MKILIVGGTGSISTRFAKRCVDLSMDVTMINRGNHLDRIPHGVRLVRADINTFEENSIDWEWDSVIDFTILNKQHAERAVRLFSGYTKQFIFINSTCAYKHSYLGQKITEQHPLEDNPVWKYQKDKYEARNVLIKSHLPLVEVRPGHTYDDFTIPTNIVGIGYGLIKRIKDHKEIIMHDDGLALWTLTHSRDVCIGLSGLVGQDKTIGECFNITNDTAVKWIDLMSEYGRILKVKPRFVFIPSVRIGQIDEYVGDSLLAHRAFDKQFDNTKIKKFVPEYDPKISYQEGLKDCINWHESHPDKIFYNKNMDVVIDKIIQAHKEREVQKL